MSDKASFLKKCETTTTIITNIDELIPLMTYMPNNYVIRLFKSYDEVILNNAICIFIHNDNKIVAFYKK